jgi:2-iminobutanoate/2-iminopropanoate deaminase
VRQKIATGLAEAKGPVSTAVTSGGFLFTAQIAKDAHGDIVPGDIRVQTRQVLENLRTTIAAAGGSLRDVAQVLVYLIDRADFDAMNEVYAGFFEAPYPARATVVVKELVAPGLRVEIVAVCHVEGPAGERSRRPPLAG